MDIVRTATLLGDLPIRIWRRIAGQYADYRGFLFEDLQKRLDGRKPRRILEIGPRDGEDTRRLATLGAEKIVLVDLPNQQANIESWLPALGPAPIELVISNFMYDPGFEQLEPFDVV